MILTIKNHSMSAKSTNSKLCHEKVKDQQQNEEHVDDQVNLNESEQVTTYDNIQAFQIKLCEYNAKMNDHAKQMKDMQQYGKTLEKEFSIIAKIVAKTTKKNKQDKPRPLSGFAVPSALTDELYEFLNIEKSELVPRKDVTKMINEYIKKNNCRDEKDKRNIIPDAALKKLFRSKDGEKITYFNLQTYMKHHYIKR